ncbi:MAG: hypothetical protein KJ607_02970, partial [Bacteroidetes bacterium]|nr:hypothetical protein [Bacteroidota bacterium]
MNDKLITIVTPDLPTMILFGRGGRQRETHRYHTIILMHNIDNRHLTLKEFKKYREAVDLLHR